jgi:hypothetical protein
MISYVMKIVSVSSIETTLTPSIVLTFFCNFDYSSYLKNYLKHVKR